MPAVVQLKRNPRQVSAQFDSLQCEIGYQFKRISLLIEALTHASFGASNNKRLEFLGDSVLRMVLSEQLYTDNTEYDQRQLTQTRSSLESNLNLAEISRRLKIDQLLLVSRGAKKDGVIYTDQVLAGAFEAVLGAVYLDGSIDDVRRLITEHVISQRGEPQQDSHPKTLLQERLDRDQGIRPTYALVGADGPENLRRWRVRCVIKDLNLETIGTGSSRKKAETQAAASMLELLQT